MSLKLLRNTAKVAKKMSKHIAVRDITHTTAGLIGEHIAAAAILQRGWGCAMAQSDGMDLVAWNKQTGQKILVQVKSCQMSRSARANSTQFQLGMGGVKDKSGVKRKRLPTKSDYDLLALVSSEHRACVFMAVSDVKQLKINKPASFFENPHIEEDSFHKAIERICNG